MDHLPTTLEAELEGLYWWQLVKISKKDDLFATKWPGLRYGVNGLFE